MLNTPVLFLVFNRLDTTKQVFAKIQEAKPKQLFVAADGARIDKIGEQEKVEEVRKFIIDNIDWDCEVKTLFREKNLGCGKAVSEGITWFFEHVEQGIILEDDILPDLSFFCFCEELLERYKYNECVMMISGYCSFGKMKSDYSYSFTQGSGGIWGWASWRRTWNMYDYKMKGYLSYKEVLKQDIIKETLIKYFDDVYNGKIDTWDYQLAYTIEKNKGFSINPNRNLIKNIGFSENSTHTSNWENQVYLPNKYTLLFPIVHPEEIKVNEDYIYLEKEYIKKQTNGEYSKLKMLKLKIKKYLKII